MLDPFKLLGVDKDAPPEEIKRAYYKLAKKYHPDHLPEGVKETYIEHFLRLTWAYKILIDKKKREAYLRDIALGEFEHEVEKQRREAREKLFKEGLIIIRNNPVRAEKYLKMAYMLDKTNPLFMSYYGLVLVFLNKVKDGVELMEKALKKDNNIIELHLNLAEGLISAGRIKEAKGYLKRASRIDRKNSRLLKLLEKMKRRKYGDGG